VVELHADFKARRAPDYAVAIRAIQSRGITVNGCFVLGLDSHGPEIFDAVRDFADRNALYEVQITVMTAFPGTPLHERLAREGRILEPGRWELCTLFDINITPKNMTVEQLQSGFLNLVKRLYSAEETTERRSAFKSMLKVSPNFGRRAAREQRLLAA